MFQKLIGTSTNFLNKVNDIITTQVDQLYVSESGAQDLKDSDNTTQNNGNNALNSARMNSKSSVPKTKSDEKVITKLLSEIVDHLNNLQFEELSTSTFAEFLMFQARIGDRLKHQSNEINFLKTKINDLIALNKSIRDEASNYRSMNDLNANHKKISDTTIKELQKETLDLKSSLRVKETLIKNLKESLAEMVALQNQKESLESDLARLQNQLKRRESKISDLRVQLEKSVESAGADTKILLKSIEEKDNFIRQIQMQPTEIAKMINELNQNKKVEKIDKEPVQKASDLDPELELKLQEQISKNFELVEENAGLMSQIAALRTEFDQKNLEINKLSKELKENARNTQQQVCNENLNSRNDENTNENKNNSNAAQADSKTIQIDNDESIHAMIKKNHQLRYRKLCDKFIYLLDEADDKLMERKTADEENSKKNSKNSP